MVKAVALPLESTFFISNSSFFRSIFVVFPMNPVVLVDLLHGALQHRGGAEGDRQRLERIPETRTTQVRAHSLRRLVHLASLHC